MGFRTKTGFGVVIGLAALWTVMYAAGAIGVPDVWVSEECRVRGGIPNALAKLRSGETVRVAYLGGSITEANPGWRAMTLAWFRARCRLDRRIACGKDRSFGGQRGEARSPKTVHWNFFPGGKIISWN